MADDIISEPYAKGTKFTSRPDDPYNKVTIESLSGDLQLFDGRMNHNNGWFVLRSNIKPGVTKGAVKWIITPNVVADWMYQPVIQTSQIGYHPLRTRKPSSKWIYVTTERKRHKSSALMPTAKRLSRTSLLPTGVNS